MRAIINGKIITRYNVVEDKVIIFDSKIEALVNRGEIEETVKNYKYGKLDLIDAMGNYVSSGFIDLHIHGSGGKDTMDGNLEDLRIISKVIVKNGVTAFLPTTMTMSKEKIYKALDTIKEGMKQDLGGAKVLGAHMEGPFINSKYKGAQNENYIVEPDYNFIKGYEEVIKIITLAPEKDVNFEFIKLIKDKTDIVLSIGHSDATYEEAMEAIRRGVSHATHLFNAMTPFNHRNPGIVGAAFNSNINCELIADKIHVHPEIFQTVIKIKGTDKLILITDSMRAGCLKEGISDLGGQKVIVKNNSARLEDGTLAGSILTLNKALENLVKCTSLEIYEVVAMVTLNAAKDIGISDKKGSLELGKDADITIFDENFDIKQTIVEGKTVFVK
jgi:N-acetylglucosamine-6-phosphate deacetylase